MVVLWQGEEGLTLTLSKGEGITRRINLSGARRAGVLLVN